MPTYWGSIAQGIGQGITQGQQQQARELEIQNYRRQMEQQRLDEARKLQAEQGVGATLGALYAPPPVTQAPQPPMPGQPSVPGAQAQPQGQGSVGVPPYRTVQSAGAAAQQPTQPMPQGAPPAVQPQGAPPAVQPQGQMQRPTVENVMRIMAANGVPQDQWLGQLERLKPVFDAANREEVEQLKVQNAQLQQRKLDIYERNVESQIRKRGGAGGGEGGAGGTGGIGPSSGFSNYDKLSPADKKTVDFYAQMAIGGDRNWRTGLSRDKQGPKLIREVMARVADLKSGAAGDVIANQADLQALNATLKNRETYSAGVSQASRRVDEQIKLVDERLDKAGLNTPTILNTKINALRGAMSDPQYTTLNTAIVTLTNEMQRLNTAATSNAQLHATTEALYNNLLNGNMSIAQLRDMFKLLRQEAAATTRVADQEVADLKGKIRSIGAGAGGAGTVGAIPSGWSVNEVK